MNSPTDIADLDREILLKLSDQELINTCKTNKYFLNVVCNDLFFKRRLQLVYPDTLQFFNIQKHKNYKQYYLHVVYYISKMKEDYDYIYSKGNPKKQYELLTLHIPFDRNARSVNNYNELLLDSSEENEISLVKEALNKGADINFQTSLSLYNAAASGNLEIVKYLIENGALDLDGAMRAASGRGYLNIVKYLVENGANIHSLNELALRLASKYGDLNIVKYLVEKGADIHVFDDHPLQLAKEQKHLDVVEYLKSLN